MKRLESLLEGDDGFFGPGTDLAISLAAVLLLMIAIRSNNDEHDRNHRRLLEAELRNQKTFVEKERQERLNLETKLQSYRHLVDSQRQGQIEIKEVLQNQARLVESFADLYGTTYRNLGKNTYAITMDSADEEHSQTLLYKTMQPFKESASGAMSSSSRTKCLYCREANPCSDH